MDENPRAFEQSQEPDDGSDAHGQPPEWDDEPGVFEVFDPEAEAAADARARADVAAGRVVPHEKVVEWLKTWGTPDEKPMPREWLT